MGILSWFDGTRFPEEPRWLRRWVILARRRREDPKLQALRKAVAADVSEMEAEDRKYFRPDGPARREDGA